MYQAVCQAVGIHKLIKQNPSFYVSLQPSCFQALWRRCFFSVIAQHLDPTAVVQGRKSILPKWMVLSSLQDSLNPRSLLPLYRDLIYYSGGYRGVRIAAPLILLLVLTPFNRGKHYCHFRCFLKSSDRLKKNHLSHLNFIITLFSRMLAESSKTE